MSFFNKTTSMIFTDKFVSQKILNTMNEQQKMVVFGFNKMTENQKQPGLSSEIKQKKEKEIKPKKEKEIKPKKELMSSTLLTQKAAGYMLASANAAKKEKEIKSKKEKEINQKKEKDINPKKELMMSTLLTQKAAGYMLASANTSKRENKLRGYWYEDTHIKSR